MKSKRFILNALLVVAILTLLVFSYSYMNQPRFGYALYAVFSGETTYNTYNTIGFIDAIFFYVVGPVSSELIAFVVSYNLNQQSQTHSATSAKQGINLFAIMIILQIAAVLIIALTATNVLNRELPDGNCRGYSGFVYDSGKEVAQLTGPIWNPNHPWSRRCRFWCCPISPDQFILLILAELRVWQNRHWMAAR